MSLHFLNKQMLINVSKSCISSFSLCFIINDTVHLKKIFHNYHLFIIKFTSLDQDKIFLFQQEKLVAELSKYYEKNEKQVQYMQI